MEDVWQERLRKATCIIARRLRDADGRFDGEAVWAIGILSTVSELEVDELLNATEVFSRITFASPGEKKIQAIKCVRTYLHCGLKEGKEIVEGTRHAEATPEQARLIKEECERDCGSNVIVRPWQAHPSERTLGRGLDLDPEPEPSDDDIPF